VAVERDLTVGKRALTLLAATRARSAALAAIGRALVMTIVGEH
jgi:hypothetical protein